MSEGQHTKDLENQLPHHKASASAGGKCLNRHISYKPCDGQNNSCSHRWQSYLRMEEDKGLYNYPAYQSLIGRRNIPTAAYEKDGVKIPDWYSFTLNSPTMGSWDIGVHQPGQKAKNFWGPCYIPYWHEAHHIVPNSTLREAINSAAKGLTFQSAVIKEMRRGLLDAGYNLNFKVNMIMLPIDAEVSDSIQLPRHRHTARHRNHVSYNNYIKDQLEPILSAMAKDIKDHNVPNYSVSKQRIDNISKKVYKEITNAIRGGKRGRSLDEYSDKKAKRRRGS
ncbi:AHH domain-containing protein [Sulfidibacter corallicola]|uniref:AHH domain-containing protein n=1 Tax=Sulfidibacter corallicola TaxID=2818388 RepID=A0A8A4TPW6_SULCO|nr:AHH domain-containing protein [Sulfidibacter corallicola]QTD51600.1 AHH domain-containing protein [Sulfidibacter corallicola]